MTVAIRWNGRDNDGTAIVKAVTWRALLTKLAQGQRLGPMDDHTFRHEMCDRCWSWFGKRIRCDAEPKQFFAELEAIGFLQIIYNPTPELVERS